MRWTHSMRRAGSSAAAPQTSDFPAESRFTRAFLAVDTVVIMALAFSFAFGNGWDTARHLGISHYIAPLIQPAVDLAVVGLMVGVRYLAKHGWTERELSKPRRWMKFFGLLTLAMNTGESLYNHQWGRAGWDAIGPILLIAWSELGPWLSGAIYSVHRQQALAAVQLPPAAPEPVKEAEPECELVATPEEGGQDAGVLVLTETQQDAEFLKLIVRMELIKFNRAGGAWQDNPGAGVAVRVREQTGRSGLTQRRINQVCAEQWKDLYRLRQVDSAYVGRSVAAKGA